MKKQVLLLSQKGIIDTSFIGLDSTPIAANTSQNNPKSFLSNKFSKPNQPDCDKDCKLGVHTASNQTNEKSLNSSGATKTMSSLTVSQVFLSMNLQQLPMSMIPPLPSTFLQRRMNSYLLRSVTSWLIKAMMSKKYTIRWIHFIMVFVSFQSISVAPKIRNCFLSGIQSVKLGLPCVQWTLP